MKYVDPVQLAVSPAGLAQRSAACASHARVRVAVIVNPRARRLVQARQRQALAELVEDGLYVESHDLASLERNLARLVAVEGANVVAVAGGDGTLHHIVNALWQLQERTLQASGQSPPWPRILILNGGTLNVVGRSVAIHGPPDRTLRTFLRRFADVPLSRVPVRPQPLLHVAWEGQAPRLGFVFGSAVAHHALELYTRFGAGYIGLARFLGAFARGAVLGGTLWNQESWRIGPYEGVDIQPCSGTPHHVEVYTGLVASTADLTLAVAALRAIRRPLGAAGFAVRLVEATEPVQLAAMLPALMGDAEAPGMRDFPEVRHLRLRGPCTLDGEVFEEPAPDLALHVSRHPEVLALVGPTWV